MLVSLKKSLPKLNQPSPKPFMNCWWQQCNMPVCSRYSGKRPITSKHFIYWKQDLQHLKLPISTLIDLAFEILTATGSELVVVIYISLSLLISLWCPFKMIDLQSSSSSVGSRRVKMNNHGDFVPRRISVYHPYHFGRRG